MNNPQLRKPLLQAGIVLAVACILILFVSNAHPTSLFDAIGAVFCGIFASILFIVGLSISLIVAIAILIAIFFAGMALYSSEKASSIYLEFKTRLFEMGAEYADSFYSSCTNQPPTSKIPTEELEQLKKSLSQTEIEKNHMEKNAASMQEEIEESKRALENQEKTLDLIKEEKEALHQELEEMKELLQSAEKERAEREALVTSLNAENSELISKAAKLQSKISEIEQQQESSSVQSEQSDKLAEENSLLKQTIKELEEKVKELEDEAEKSPEAGIFSYIEDEAEKDLLANKAKKVASQDLTYAQMNDLLTEELPAHLDKILKEHPSLTKIYLRNLRRENE